jgi:hypothetical protein
MIKKWFSQKEANGGVRHRLYKRNTNHGAWGQSSYFIDAAPNSAHFTMGKKYGLYGSGMGAIVDAVVPYRIAACFGGFSKLSEAKKEAEKLLTLEVTA